ncbi:MAG TPA: ChaN family lipoprotein [Planctomycetota bacterium]
MHSRLLVVPSLLLLAGLCTARAPQEPAAWDAPRLERSVAVRDGRTGAAVPFAEFLGALAAADAVFLGEYHTDETTHRVELGVLQALAARRSGRVVLAMEMFERDVQGALDAYLAGTSSEPEFRAAARPWGNYDTGYRPLIEFAKAQGLPVVASNFPRPLRSSLAAMGADPSLDALDEKARAQAPRELTANSPKYWRRVDNAIRGHIGMMNVDQEDDERLYSTQSLWDNSMGEACAVALDAHPGSSVLHVNGGFHSAYWDGTVRQFRLHKPDAKVVTVAIEPTTNPAVAEVRGAPVADYVVFAETRATDLNEGTFSVYVQRGVKYRLHLPEPLREGQRVPLLIWFADDGFNSEDGIALWKSRFGKECAIAVVEAPYRETQDDLVEGGRWFWPDTFASDLGAMEGAAEGIWAYLMRHYPLDRARVCIAGEGTGATVVAAVSLSSSRMDARAVAFEPRHYAKIKDIPLPLPEFRGSERQPEKSLQLFLGADDQEWWAGELAEYQAIGFESRMTAATEDPWRIETERENALRTALGFPASNLPADAPRRHILAEGPRAQLWARLLGVEQTQNDGALVAVLAEEPAAGSSTEIEIGADPEDFADGKGLPRCPGPFGGTTVLVLPESAPATLVAAWLALEAADPLNKASRFHHLRVATTGAERDLPAVLAELAGQNRKNVLIVPAAFCADGETMRALRSGVRTLEDRMTLQWRPGLGG